MATGGTQAILESVILGESLLFSGWTIFSYDCENNQRKSQEAQKVGAWAANVRVSVKCEYNLFKPQDAERD